MKIDQVQSFSLLTCKDFCRMMEEDGASQNDTLHAHLARCSQCRREYELIMLMRDSRVAAVPPADLTGNVMRRIRAERAKIARRRAVTRIAGVACAAILLVPAITVLVPFLSPSGDLSAAPMGEDAVSYTSGGDTLYAVDTGAVGSPADEAANAGSGKMDYSVPPSNLPDEYYFDGTGAPVSPLSTTSSHNAESDGTEDFVEPVFYETLRARVGADAFDAWLSQYDGDAADAEAAAYAYFGIEPQ